MRLKLVVEEMVVEHLAGLSGAGHRSHRGAGEEHDGFYWRYGPR